MDDGLAPEAGVPDPRGGQRDEAPRLDGVHHLKLPVRDLDRSLRWYSSRLGYVQSHEFVEDGRLVGLALSHPNGGPRLALRVDPERAEAAAGFDYFAFGVPTPEALTELTNRFDRLGDRNPGIVRGTQGWVLPHVKDPDGHELRFYAHEAPEPTPTERPE